MYTDALGPQAMPQPEALTEAGLQETRDEFVRAATNAIEAGFDGVELHAANGYLLEQFLNPHSNVRSDGYGGSAAQRNRFVLEVVEATRRVIGSHRVGIRLSPYSTFNGLPVYDEVKAQYASLARELGSLLYVHIIRNAHSHFEETARAMRQAFKGPFIVNGGFDGATAEDAIAAGRADLVSFGRPFIANPNFVNRLQRGTALASADTATFYTPGAKGYVNYPSLHLETPRKLAHAS